MTRGLAAVGGGDTERLERPVLAGVLLVEIALVILGFALGTPLMAAAAAAAVAFFLVAFRFPDLAWGLVWVAVPASMEIPVGSGTALTVPIEPMILLALLAWVARAAILGGWRMTPSPLHLPLASLATLALVSAIWSVKPLITIKNWVMLAGYVAFSYLYQLQGEGDRARRSRWILVVSLTGAAWGVFGIVRVLTVGGSEQQALRAASTISYGAYRPFFHEHGTFSAYLGLLLPAALVATLERTAWSRVLYGLCTLCIGLAIVLAFARAGWLAILLVLPLTLVLWLLWRRSARRLLLPAAILVAVVLAVGALGVSRQLSRHAGTVVSSENVSNLERLNRWAAALEMARDRPLTGVGFGGFLDAYPHYRRRVLGTEQAYIRMGTHSEVLKLLSELGIPGLLLAMWLLFTVGRLGIRALFRLRNPEDRLLALAALAGVATYCVNGLFNSYLVEEKVTVPFWAAIGLIGALDHRAAADGDER